MSHFQHLLIYPVSGVDSGPRQWGSMELSISMTHFKHLLTYLVSNVDSSPCLEEVPHHTGVAFGGCNHQCSVSTLRDSGGGMPYHFTLGTSHIVHGVQD